MAFPGTYSINYYEGDRYEFVIYPKDAAGNVFNLNLSYGYKQLLYGYKTEPN